MCMHSPYPDNVDAHGRLGEAEAWSLAPMPVERRSLHSLHSSVALAACSGYCIYALKHLHSF